MKRSGFAVIAGAVMLLVNGVSFLDSILGSFFAVWLVGLLGPRAHAERVGALVIAGWCACAWTGRGGYFGAAFAWLMAGAAISWALRPLREEA